MTRVQASILDSGGISGPVQAPRSSAANPAVVANATSAAAMETSDTTWLIGLFIAPPDSWRPARPFVGRDDSSVQATWPWSARATSLPRFAIRKIYHHIR